jgi:antirestriction protein ArdC
MAKPKKEYVKKDLYQEATDKIIAALESGTAPWQRPWELKKGGGLPFNGATNNRYHGINVLLLALASAEKGWTDNRFATFKQGKDLGTFVKAGEKGTTIYFSKPMRVPEKGPDGQQVTGADGQPKVKNIYLLRAHTVFNASQFDAFPSMEAIPQPKHDWESSARVDAIAKGYGVPIVHGGNEAYYTPTFDRIQMPEREQFPIADNYYATLMHEIGHSTGHPSRLNRVLNGNRKSTEYAFEELIAEMSSLYITSDLGLTGVTEDANVSRHAAYVGSWLEALNKDKKMIFKAAREAERVHELVMSFDPVAKLTAKATAEVDEEEMDASLGIDDESAPKAGATLENASAALAAIDEAEAAPAKKSSRGMTP